MRKPYILLSFSIIIVAIACYELAMTSTSAPPVSRTGAPGETSCSACHGNLNTGPGDILLSLDTIQYIPGNTYTASLQVVDGGKSKFGFQITVLDTNDNMAGSFIVTNTTNTSAQSGFGRGYLGHKNANSTSTWQFDWVAPGSDLGPLTFYVAGNGANNNNSSSGDNIYTRSFMIQSCPVTSSIVGSSVVCNGETTGSADLTVTGGDLPYTFAWSTSDTTEDVSNLAAGTYYVTITDSSSCTVTDSIVITEPLPIGGTFSVIEPSCFGICDGSVTGAPTGGTGSPSTWGCVWSNGDTGLTAVNLCTGMITVIMIDSVGCTANDSVLITEPAILANSGTSTDVSCFGLCNGNALTNISGGTPPYTFAWDDPNSDTNLGVTGLCAGTYHVTVTDSNGCVLLDTFPILEPTILSATISSKSDEVCGGACDGSATVSASGGTTPYTYTWSGICTSSSCTNVCAGTFSVTVTDNNGCNIVLTDSIQGPTPLSNIVGSTNSTCGIADGSTYIVESGGVPPYTYLWDDPLSQTNDTAFNLLSGTYTVLVIDSNGCPDSESVSVSDIGGPIITTDTLTSPTCNAGMDGAIFISISGNAPPFTFSWDNGETVEDIDSLTAGTYTVTVVDSLNCSRIEAILLLNPAIITGTSSENICAGDSIFLQGNYQSSAGTYVDTLTDLNGCDSIHSTSLLVNSTPSVSFTGLDSIYCSDESAILMVGSPSGGIFTGTGVADDYFYPTTGAATYLVTYTVTDSMNCSASSTHSVMVNFCVGIKEASSVPLIKIYPNPNDGNFILNFRSEELQDIKLSILNITGQIVYTDMVAVQKGTFENTISIKYMPPGIYFLQLVTSAGLYTRKLVIR